MSEAMELIKTPDSLAMSQLVEWLSEHSPGPSDVDAWPSLQLERCAEFGVHRWFIPAEYGGFDWSGGDVTRGYFALASACLTTSFVITQRVAACRRIASSDNADLKRALLPPLADGSLFATVGISHLTTSHRHLKEPVCRARREGDAWRLEGFSPWVTGGRHADVMVVGAVTDTGQQVLFAVPGHAPGVVAEPPLRLVALSASQTGRVRFDNVLLRDDQKLAGPAENVLATGVGGGTGGVQTSAVALGLAQAAVGYLEREAELRRDLVASTSELKNQLLDLQDQLIRFASGDTSSNAEAIRQQSNSLVMRATTSAMVAAKGAGFVEGHVVGRWCREALFFLVWSCPQSVLQGNLCELAGIAT